VTRDDLPETLPIFPIAGALLLPGGDLPLNIFEPRYLAMTKAALAGDRLIGMIQPCPCPGKTASGARPYYETGCAGRISSFEETGDGRFLINLQGVARFKLQDYELTPDGYFRGHVNFDEFKNDLSDSQCLPKELSGPCLEKLKVYLDKEGLFVDWDLARHIPDHRFYTLLAMVCPFSPAEKQALLEAGSFAERCQMLKTLLDIACAEDKTLAGDRLC
jgi:Lon protease-like protein